MKKNKKENKKLSNMATFIIVIMIMFMSIVCVELITVIYSEKINTDLTNSTLNNNANSQEKNEKKYDTSALNYIKIELSDLKYGISDSCLNECNFKVMMYGEEYFYVIKKGISEEYNLIVVKNNNVLLENKNLGKSLEKSYFISYMNYILFYNMIEDSTYIYDDVLIVDNRGYVDEFASLNNNEMEITENGIIYYYDVCSKEGNTNAKKIKAIRIPYSKNPTEIGSELTNFAWCN